ncbi:uncharacterized protein EV420DRAFT_1636451 [Desarmillaria tabescens]|uniref:Uncharacterized protein n=1 Tax=Armillaria tabescens TaxID=1929756 RepID=A0AA39NI03_ARMTA|nr:uncharacterized protein EV420DRAFT_1636451 [Desarmillaria tabescens]KAK0465889.1 hypothetical protein EV420DRAFT_1636451 [Desarmillaria tabescens]
MVVIIILLYIVATINFVFNWLYIRSIFVDHGQNFRTRYLSQCGPSFESTVEMGVTGAICTILADSTIIWRCWVVWGRRWLTVLLPVLLLISGTVFKIISTYEISTITAAYPLGFALYSAFILATTLWCTVLIIYRIVTVARGSDTGSGFRTYSHVIEIMVESSALYSLTLILYVIFYAREDVTIALLRLPSGDGKGTLMWNCPALLVGRVAAGHARPDDSWQGSMISGSLHFRTRSGGQNSQQNSFTISDDLEGHEREDEHTHHMLKGSREDTVNKIVVCRDGPEVRLERLGDSQFISGTVVYEDDIENV